VQPRQSRCARLGFKTDTEGSRGGNGGDRVHEHFTPLSAHSPSPLGALGVQLRPSQPLLATIDPQGICTYKLNAIKSEEATFVLPTAFSFGVGRPNQPALLFKTHRPHCLSMAAPALPPTQPTPLLPPWHPAALVPPPFPAPPAPTRTFLQPHDARPATPESCGRPYPGLPNGHLPCSLPATPLLPSRGPNSFGSATPAWPA